MQAGSRSRYNVCMDLFTHASQQRMKSEAPLAARMRPRNLDEYIGQEHILGPGKLLRRAIEADRLFSSILLWGPPGTGKTTLAQVIANTTKSHFETLSAVLAGKAERILRAMLTEPQRAWKITDLARAVDVSLSQVANVKKMLVEYYHRPDATVRAFFEEMKTLEPMMWSW